MVKSSSKTNMPRKSKMSNKMDHSPEAKLMPGANEDLLNLQIKDIDDVQKIK